MDIVEHSTDWIEFDAETDEVPFLHMHDMIEVEYIHGIDLCSPVPAWSVDFDNSRYPVGSRYPVVAYRLVKKADASETAQLRKALREIYEVYAGSEGIPQPMTAAEGYLLSLLMEAVEIASKALKEKE